MCIGQIYIGYVNFIYCSSFILLPSNVSLKCFVFTMSSSSSPLLPLFFFLCRQCPFARLPAHLCLALPHHPHFLYPHFIPFTPPRPSIAAMRPRPRPPNPAAFSNDGNSMLPNPTANPAMIDYQSVSRLSISLLRLHNYNWWFSKYMIFQIVNISVHSVSNYCTVSIFSCGDVLNMMNGNSVGGSFRKKSIILLYTC